MEKRKINLGIGFSTGRKSFQKVLKSYIYNFNEYSNEDREFISLNLFVAYDLTYQKTKVTDFTNINPETVAQTDSATFIGKAFIKEEIDYLVGENVINYDEARLIFGKGYAARRNAILYNAVKQGMDFLIFLDDDEYPLALTNTRNNVVWGGQHVLSTHLSHINQADITHGHHCGYISPIPYIEFDDTLSESDFRIFIEAISNDILSWDKVLKTMKDGGVTYADTDVLTSGNSQEVREVNRAKFISGANLCINLRDPHRLYPFFNPPGARGEDTFLSTCLSDRKVLRVPCYTFHDGFSTYHCLLEGVLPTRLKFARADSEASIIRFQKACIGWIRYKPLLLYITNTDNYEAKIQEMRGKLQETLPKIAAYFHHPEFINGLAELEKYHRNVGRHYREFKETQAVWSKVMDYLARQRKN